jgi:asparagine synthetase B (glutamine-hydrolysing)
MCGIFGWHCAEELTKTQKHKTRVLAGVLAHTNDNRGGDSWGAYMHGKVFKGLGDMVGAGSHVFDRMAHAKVCLAHTRKATLGTVNIKNAHPFECGKIVGAHNGIVSNHSELNWKFGRKCEVDSEHIFLNLSEDKPFEDIQAWGAIEYVDKEIGEESAFIGRFNSGELAIAKIEGFGIVWSSEQNHLMSAIGISGIGTPTFFEVEKDKLYVAKDNDLYEERPLDFDYPWYNKHKSKATKISSGIYRVASDSTTTSIKTHNNETYDVDARWESLKESGSTETIAEAIMNKRPYLFNNCSDCQNMVLRKTICGNCFCCTMCCPGYCDRRQIGMSDEQEAQGMAMEEALTDITADDSDEEKTLRDIMADDNDAALERYRNVVNPNTEN